MSPDDLARELIADSPSWTITEGSREGVAVGLTWASLVPADQDDFDQDAVERANGKAMEKLLDGIEDAEWQTVGAYLAVRVLDLDGDVTPEGRAAAEAMGSLADYPVLDNHILSEVEHLGFEHDWAHEVEEAIEGGHFDVWRPSYEQLEVIDDLPKNWQTRLFNAYRDRDTGGDYDDRGYATVDRDLVASILEENGWLVEEEDEED